MCIANSSREVHLGWFIYVMYEDEEEAKPDYQGLGCHVNTFTLYLESSGIC